MIIRHYESRSHLNIYFNVVNIVNSVYNTGINVEVNRRCTFEGKLFSQDLIRTTWQRSDRTAIDLCMAAGWEDLGLEGSGLALKSKHEINPGSAESAVGEKRE